MIPKIIHYVWVGDNPKSELVLKCIETWKRFCPDYEIIEWGNNEVAAIDNLYVSQAFESKKWAFVSDYLRLYALYKHGGFYFDTDLEITNNLDCFLNNKFISGFEDFKGKISPITALMAAEPKNDIIKNLLKEYDNIPFIKNGQLDQTTNTARITKYFEQNFGLKKPYNPDEKIKLTEKSIIYPSYYFCNPKDGKENYSIHHYNGSWVDAYSRKLILNFKNFRIVRFHKRKNIKDDKLPILNGEKILTIFKIFNYKIVFLRLI